MHCRQKKTYVRGGKDSSLPQICPTARDARHGAPGDAQTAGQEISLPLPVPTEIVALLTAEDGTEDAAQYLENDDENDKCEEIVHSLDV